MKKSLKELSAEIYALEQKKELTAEEQDLLRELKAEFENGLRELNRKAAEAAAGGSRRKTSAASERMREWLKSGSRDAFLLKREDEVPAAGSDDSSEDTTPTAYTGTVRTNVAETEAKVVHGVMDAAPYAPTVYDKAGCPVQYNAKGLHSWPFVNNAVVTIAGELTPIGDAQVLDMSDIQEVRVRLTAKILISWQAIEDNNVDLITLAKAQISKAYEAQINHVACSSAKWAENFYGGFAHSSKQSGTYASTGFTFAKAMEMVGKVASKEYGVEGGVFVMGSEDFWALKATPKDSGSGLMVIDDNNRIGGFPVMESNDINRTAVKGTISGHNIGFGLFKFLPALQHGDVRMTVDSTSVSAADVDGVYIICNADWSMTDLRPDAFVLYAKGS